MFHCKAQQEDGHRESLVDIDCLASLIGGWLNDCVVVNVMAVMWQIRCQTENSHVSGSVLLV